MRSTVPMQKRRGVTRAYVHTLLFAALTLQLACTIALWGFTALAFNRKPIETPVHTWVVPVIFLLLVALAYRGLWNQSIRVLKGFVSVPAWHSLFWGALAYGVWSILGTFFGLQIQETWLSVYAFELIPIFFIISLACWWVLVRRLYAEDPTLKWYWEKTSHREDEEDL